MSSLLQFCAGVQAVADLVARASGSAGGSNLGGAVGLLEGSQTVMGLVSGAWVHVAAHTSRSHVFLDRPTCATLLICATQHTLYDT